MVGLLLFGAAVWARDDVSDGDLCGFCVRLIGNDREMGQRGAWVIKR